MIIPVVILTGLFLSTIFTFILSRRNQKVYEYRMALINHALSALQAEDYPKYLYYSGLYHRLPSYDCMVYKFWRSFDSFLEY